MNSNENAIVPRDTDLVPDHVKKEQEEFFNKVLCFRSLKGLVKSKNIELPIYLRSVNKDVENEGEFFACYTDEGILLVRVQMWQYGKRVCTIDECNDLDADVLKMSTKEEFESAFKYVKNVHDKIAKINNN